MNAAVTPALTLNGVAALPAILGIARHVPVFPCRRDKKPLTENGFKDASQDETLIRRWWAEHPDALVGVPTGATTGMVALDFDPHKRTDATDEWIATHTDTLLSARVHATLRGGKHYLFRIAKEQHYRSGADLTLGGTKRPGIDLRADGGYIIWWPLHGGATAGQGAAPLLPAGILDERLVAPPKPSSTTPQPLPPKQWAETEAKLLAALPLIDPGPRDTWRDVGMAISLETGGADHGFSLWQRWSAGELTGDVPGDVPENYAGVEECRRQWDSYRHETTNPVTLGSVFRLAKLAAPVPDEDAPVRLIPGTDRANAERFVERHGQDCRCTFERGWLVWSGKKWQVDEKGMAVASHAMESADSMLDELKTTASSERDKAYAVAKAAAQKRAIEAAIWMARSACSATLNTFDAQHMLFNCQNGVIDLTTGQLKPHYREAYCSFIGGCDYDPDAQAPRWLQFLDEITMGRADLAEYLQRMAGYLLTGCVDEQCLFFFHGGGSNGKTTFVETISHCMGEYAISAQTEMLMLQNHTAIPNDVARLRGARACFLNETDKGKRFDETKLKQLTGGDTLNARFLREEFFDFKPTHKLILRGNHKPTVSGTDEGIWRRMRLVPWDLRLDDEHKDRHLLPTLAQESPGILAWMVRGCLAWQREGLGTPQVVRDAVAEYRQESDTLGRFIEECCVQRKNAQIKTSALHKAYRDFCEAAGERYLSAKDFPGELENRGLQRKKTNQERLTLGVELASAINPTWEREAF